MRTESLHSWLWNKICEFDFWANSDCHGTELYVSSVIYGVELYLKLYA